MKTPATIRRASQQARNAMRELDAQAARDLLALYQAAAIRARSSLAALCAWAQERAMQGEQS